MAGGSEILLVLPFASLDEDRVRARLGVAVVTGMSPLHAARALRAVAHAPATPPGRCPPPPLAAGLARRAGKPWVGRRGLRMPALQALEGLPARGSQHGKVDGVRGTCAMILAGQLRFRAVLRDAPGLAGFLLDPEDIRPSRRLRGAATSPSQRRAGAQRCRATSSA